MWVFPYPRCWARVLLTLVSATVGGLAIGLVTAFLIVPVAKLAGQITGYLWLHAVVRQWVAMRKESLSWSWIPEKRFWYESLIDWLILASSAVFVQVVYTAPTMLALQGDEIVMANLIRIGAIAVVPTVFLMAYIHQVRFLILQFWENRQRQRRKAKDRATLPRVKRPARIIQDDESGRGRGQ